MFITLLLQLRLTIAQAWRTSCTSEQRGEFASVQGPRPTEGADRKEERTIVDERERKREGETERERNSARPSCSGTLLHSIFIPLINSILVAPFIHSCAHFSLPLSLSLSCARAHLSFFSHSIPFPLFILHARVNTHVHSSHLCLTSARIADIPLFRSHLSLSLIQYARLFLCFSPFFLSLTSSLPVSPLFSRSRSRNRARRSHSFPFLHPARHLFPFLPPPPSSHQSDTSAALWIQWRTHAYREPKRSNDLKELYWYTRWWMRCSISSFRLQSLVKWSVLLKLRWNKWLRNYNETVTR